MTAISRPHFFYRILSFFFCGSLIMSLFASQGISSANARGLIDSSENKSGYEFGDLPFNVQAAMRMAVQTRPANVLTGGTYFVVGHYEADGGWGIGHLAAAVGSEPPSWEESVWFIVQTKDSVQVALQGTTRFNEFMIDLPGLFNAQIAPHTKTDLNAQATTFLFPWDKSQQWRYSFGWHGNTGLALDFAPVNVLPANKWIIASASGTIALVCGDSYQAAITLTTPDGVMTYRHVDYNSFISQNVNNKAVTQGQKLTLLYSGTEGEGYRDISKVYPWPICTQGSSASCIYIQYWTYCGSGSGPHVHWTLPAKPFTVDGWQVDAAGVWTKSGQPDKHIGDSFSSTNPPSLIPHTFGDVDADYWAWEPIESLFVAGITGGCTTVPLNYCPDSTVTRAQMAVFLLKSMHGKSYAPPAVGASTGFSDVVTNYWAAAWIKQLAAEGITGGCGSGNYCPDSTVTRAQMAVFLLKAKHGSSYTPPNATGVFSDVSIGYWADKWIERLSAEGATSGCGVGIYCPDADVTRAQMAIFLVKTFNLP